MRLALAKLLLEKPNLLLLENPPTIWTSKPVTGWRNICTTIPTLCADLARPFSFSTSPSKRWSRSGTRRFTFYTGNYEKYLKEKTERRAQIEAAYQNQKERVEQLEVFINRFRYTATKAKQVQSRIKELERMERIEIPKEEKAIHFKFPQPKPSGRHVVEFHRVPRAMAQRPYSRGELHYRTRRSCGARGREWSGQINLDSNCWQVKSRLQRERSSGPQC